MQCYLYNIAIHKNTCLTLILMLQCSSIAQYCSTLKTPIPPHITTDLHHSGTEQVQYAGLQSKDRSSRPRHPPDSWENWFKYSEQPARKIPISRSSWYSHVLHAVHSTGHKLRRWTSRTILQRTSETSLGGRKVDNGLPQGNYWSRDQLQCRPKQRDTVCLLGCGLRGRSGPKTIKHGISIPTKQRTSYVDESKTTEAEYVAACEATKEVTWMRNLLEHIGLPQSAPKLLLCDNQDADSLANACLVLKSKTHALWYLGVSDDADSESGFF